ncbi:MAG TPA: ABC transporter permease, partial [Chitinophagaceae bacterium]|nr:ABC transporter permease [Chitinophagaceae bacterium]
MIRNYLKVAFRNLWKYKSFSAINIAGLAIGMATCLLILQYVSFKLSYDQFNKDVKDIYRVVNDRYQNGKLIQHGMITYSGISPAMQNDFSEVVNHTRVEPQGPAIIIDKNKKKIGDQNGFAVESAFLKMFNYPLIAGNSEMALKEPRSVILSATLAKKLFEIKDGNIESILDETIILQSDQVPYKVTGICEDVPENSHLGFDFLTSYSSLYSGENGWKAAEYDFKVSDFWHYVQLKPGTDYKVLDAKLPAFSQKYFQGNKVSGSDETFYLQPLSKAHLYSDFEYEIGRTGSATVVWGLLIIALFIITIAWVNYINLATARSVERAREVGIRKVVGGVRKQLISQFLTESLLVNIIAIALAFLLVFILQNGFNNLLQTKLSLSYLLTKGLSGYSILVGLILIIVTGIFVSGFYPAFVLSSFRPISVLKGKLSSSKKGIAFRKALVIGQFSITVALIIGSIVVLRQLRFMNNKELGFNMEQMLVVRAPVLTSWDSTFISRVNSFKEELKQISQVKGAATSWSTPGGDIGRSFNVRQADSATTNKFTTRHTGIDYDFINVYGIKLLAGRNFTLSDHNTDWNKLHNALLNRSAVKLLGFASPEAAIGKAIISGNKKWDVIGVVEDYHQKSLRYPLEPIRFMPAYSTNSDISVKINPTDLSKTIAAIKQKYETFFPGNIFDYSFLDENFNRQYQNEQLFSKAFGIFAALAIFVACLGLFGLAMFSTIQRTKEIGVRKVLGASVSNILVLISKAFLKLVLIASVIAFPLAWWVMNKWLQDFSYRINIGWWVFAVAGSTALLVALITVSFQAIKAAIANPVKSLRT